VRCSDGNSGCRTPPPRQSNSLAVIHHRRVVIPLTLWVPACELEIRLLNTLSTLSCTLTRVSARAPYAASAFHPIPVYRGSFPDAFDRDDSVGGEAAWRFERLEAPAASLAYRFVPDVQPFQDGMRSADANPS